MTYYNIFIIYVMITILFKWSYYDRQKKEIQILESLCSETSSKLIVVEGRRRIGKTYLVDYMFKEHRNNCLYFDCAGAYGELTPP